MKREELIKRLNAMADELSTLSSALLLEGNESIDHNRNIVILQYNSTDIFPICNMGIR